MSNFYIENFLKSHISVNIKIVDIIIDSLYELNTKQRRDLIANKINLILNEFNINNPHDMFMYKINVEAGEDMHSIHLVCGELL